MDAAVAGLIGSMGGVTLATAASVLQAARQRNWQREDEEAQRRRAANDAEARERHEAYLRLLTAAKLVAERVEECSKALTAQSAARVAISKLVGRLPGLTEEMLDDPEFEGYITRKAPEVIGLDFTATAGLGVMQAIRELRFEHSRLVLVASPRCWLPQTDPCTKSWPTPAIGSRARTRVHRRIWMHSSPQYAPSVSGPRLAVRACPHDLGSQASRRGTPPGDVPLPPVACCTRQEPRRTKNEADHSGSLWPSIQSFQT